MVDSGTLDLDGESVTWATFVDDDGPVTYYSDGSYVRAHVSHR